LKIVREASMNSGETDEVTKRLDVIISVLLNTLKKTEVPTPIGDRIGLLQDAGFATAEIGRIVGRKAQDVASIIAKSKRRKKK
jgi:hypothetical protein